MGLRKVLMEQGTRVLQDPRFSRALQDDRVVKVITRALRLRGDLEDGFDARVERLAKTFHLATQKDIRDMKRSMRRHTRELARAKREAEAARAAPAELGETAHGHLTDP